MCGIETTLVSEKRMRESQSVRCYRSLNSLRKMNTTKFIKEIESRPVLYNRVLRNHNKYSVDKYWKDVADMFGLDVQTAKHKWKGLRDTFRIELKKTIKRTPKNGYEGYRSSSWSHFNDLLFLKTVMKVQKRPVSSTTIDDSVIDTDIKVEALDSPQYSEIYVEAPSWSCNLSEENRESDDQQILENKCSNEETNDCLQNDDVYQTTDNKYKNEDDDDWLYFRSLMPYVKQLPQNKKLNFRIKIQEILNKELYEDS